MYTHFALIHNVCVSHNRSVYKIFVENVFPFSSFIFPFLLCNFIELSAFSQPASAPFTRCASICSGCTHFELHNRISWYYYIHLTIKLINWRYLGVEAAFMAQNRWHFNPFASIPNIYLFKRMHINIRYTCIFIVDVVCTPCMGVQTHFEFVPLW